MLSTTSACSNYCKYELLVVTTYKYSKSSIIGMTWSKKSSAIIEILIIYLLLYHKNRNPDNQGIILKIECFINPGIARITVTEVLIIKDSL